MHEGDPYRRENRGAAAPALGVVSLAKANRLDAGRLGWIREIEAQVADSAPKKDDPFP
jgi:hypothetical protein